MISFFGTSRELLEMVLWRSSNHCRNFDKLVIMAHRRSVLIKRCLGREILERQPRTAGTKGKIQTFLGVGIDETLLRLTLSSFAD